MSLSGQTGIVYSTVENRHLEAELFQSEEPWKGRSFYVKGGAAFIRNGFIYQTLKGINENEAWILKCEGEELEGRLQISFLDSNDSLISTKSREIKSKKKHYFSNYGVALADSQKLLVRFSGKGILTRLGALQLKPAAVFSNWEGVLGRKNNKEFGQGNIGRKFFRGKADEIRILEDLDFSTFQGRRKVFLGFLENQSIVKRIEGSIEHFSPELSHRANGPIEFRCCPAKVILDNWS